MIKKTNTEYEVNEAQYKILRNDLSGVIFSRIEDNRYYIKLGLQSYMEIANRIIDQNAD